MKGLLVNKEKTKAKDKSPLSPSGLPLILRNTMDFPKK